MRPGISICVLARDEGGKIASALASARACGWCDELLVVDTGSTDDTAAIAEQTADRVEHHAWVDFGTNRKRMVEAASHDWVFVLDADEQITPALSAEIEGLPDAAFELHPIMEMPRRNYLLGRFVRAWQPDQVSRLMDRRRVDWPARSVHDVRELREGSVGRLAGAITHNAGFDEWTDYFDGDRYGRRTEALGREMYEQGRRVGFWGMLFRPWAAFVKFYWLKGGFLDGTFGLMIAQKAALSVQLRYARLWHLQQRGGDGPGGHESSGS